jgi:hypothetical protein
MLLSSFTQPPALPARSRRLPAPHAAAARRPAWSTAGLVLALAATGCGGSDPVDETGGPGAGPGGGAAAGGVAEGGQGGGAGGELEAGSSPVMGGGSESPGDASIQTSLDGGMPIPVEPPTPLPDASVTGEPLGNAYADTEYNLERPEALVTAYGVLTGNVGNSTRLFANHLRAGDAGAEVLYGAADVLDGVLVWQMPPLRPNSFAIGVSPTGERTFVSSPFKYVLEARVPNPLNAATVFRLYLEIEQAVWSATFSADFERITSGALYGVLTRAEAERRQVSSSSDPITAGATCAALCSDIFSCGNSLTLAGLLDCNGAMPDADADDDGTNDGYRVIFSFRSSRVEPPVN